MLLQPISSRPVRISLLGLLVMSAGCLSRPPAPLENTGGAEVPLTILHSGGSQTLAFVPVYIDNQGPFAFALDTGASHSLIQARLAKQLGLPADGKAVKLSGIASVATGEQVRVENWRVGDVELPARMLVTLALAKDDESIGMQGLLGSDMLSQFGRVTIDYQEGRLTLGR